MVKYMRMVEFAQQLFERAEVASKAARILRALLEARSARLTDIAQQMSGNPEAKYKEIHRFLKQVDVKGALLRLFRADAPFLICDPTEMARPQARRTEYVGRLKDGKTRGFWLLVLATPYRGRAIPCHFVTYSSKTIRQEATSRNMNHCRALQGIKSLLGEKPLVMDREFSYLELLLNLVAEGVHFVIRLNLGSHAPTLLSKTGRRIELVVSPEQQVVYREVLYKGQVQVNVIGCWQHGFGEPLWVMSDLAPEQALKLYQHRMKIDESFRDMKSLLGIDKAMNKSQSNMEQVMALAMLAYAIGLLLGEALRDRLYGCPSSQDASARKWRLYSGLFILLKHKIPLPRNVIRQILNDVLCAFKSLVLCPVPTHV
jgi:hypothetical protein